jgi:hypothetical protein
MSGGKTIVRCAIHPSIGIARIGNAPAREYYLGPEVPGRPPEPGSSGFKNDQGQIRRQGARFRIYGYAEDGSVVKEVTADDAEIEWEVHLANRKAGWYQFTNALDLVQYAIPAPRRNPDVQVGERKLLEIDPGPRHIHGQNQSGHRFDSGYIKFPSAFPYWVRLGQLRTDEQGRLIVLGGGGTSGSPLNLPVVSAPDNNGWYDDISDGPVRAKVTLRDRNVELPVQPAMVVVTPPNYGPGLQSVVTLYDVVDNVFREMRWIHEEEPLTFWGHIYPIFKRMVSLQWVSQGGYVLFGPGSPGDLTDPAIRLVLADPGEGARFMRETVFNWFRQPAPSLCAAPPGGRLQLPPVQPHRLPPYYGDGADFYDSPLYFLGVTRTQYNWLQSWANGEFIPGEDRELPARLEDLPLREQPGALDRAPLEDCLGGPFHPSPELTWPMRVPTLWHPPDEVNGLRFRLRIQHPGAETKSDFGPVLTPEICLGPGGPLREPSGPGTLTRWLAIPWQADAASCQAGYVPSTYLPLPATWASRCPVQILSEQAFYQATQPSLPYAQRIKQLAYRQFWLRDLSADYVQSLNQMVTQWSLLGIVTQRKVEWLEREPEPGFPVYFWVETGRSEQFSNADPTWKQLLMVEGLEGRILLPDAVLRQAAATLEELVEETGKPPQELIDPRWFRGAQRDPR